MKQIFRRTAAAWIAAAVLFCIPVQAEPAISARCAVLLDANSGRVLWERNAQERALIASTTKIMTGLLVAEQVDLQSSVTIPAEAVGIEGSSIYLREGEHVTVELLLYGMMLQSGNDAASALAMHTAGNMQKFVDIMNRKAGVLGLDNTHYANPHGLDDPDNYSTALDLAKLTAYAMENPIFHQVVSTKTKTFDHRSFVNHNKLLWQYEGTVGVKTGYTRSAGRILVSCAERDGRRLIAVTIDAPDDWTDHRTLLDYGYREFNNICLLRAGDPLAEVPIINGTAKTAVAALAENYLYPVKPEEQISIACVVDQFVYAPVLAGEQAGRVFIMINGECTGELPLYWKNSVWECG